MIDPHELKNKEFSKAIKGYSIAEVDEHIDFMIEKYTELYRRNDELERQLQTAESQIEQYKKDEESIRSALVNAQRASSKIIDEANDRADALLRSTKSNCDRVLADFKQNIDHEKSRLASVTEAIRVFKAQLFAAYSEHIDYIERISPTPATDPFDIPDDNFTREVLVGVKNDLSSGKYNKNAAEKQADNAQPANISGATAQPQINAAETTAPAAAIAAQPAEKAESKPVDTRDDNFLTDTKPQDIPAEKKPEEKQNSFEPALTDELDANDALMASGDDEIPAPPDAKVTSAADKNEDTVEFTDEEFAAASDMFRTMGKKSKIEIVPNDNPENDAEPQDIDSAYSSEKTAPAPAVKPSAAQHNMSVKDTILSLNKKFAEDGNISDDENDLGDDDTSDASDASKRGKIVKAQRKLSPEEEFDAVYNPKKK